MLQMEGTIAARFVLCGQEYEKNEIISVEIAQDV